MSIHKSFKPSKGNTSASKNVQSRYERVRILQSRGKIDVDADRATGLPKTK